MKRLIVAILAFQLLLSTNCMALVTFGSGVNDSLTCGTSNAIFDLSTAFTFCGWLNPTSSSSFIFQKRSVGVAQLFFNVTGTNSLNLYKDTNNFDFARTSNSSSFTSGTRQLICITDDGSATAANAHFYVNNVEVSYAATTNGTGGLLNNSGGTVYLGNAVSTTNSFNGNFHHSAVWNSVLTSTDLTNAYNSGNLNTNWEGIETANIQADWWLTQCKNGTICTGSNLFTDVSGNSNHCTPAGNPTGLAIQNSISNGSTFNNSTVD